MKVLDDSGLAYFWTKIKAYISSLNAVLKNATNKVSVKEFLFRDVDDDALRIGGGSAHAKGGNILLYGKDHATHPGRVDFQAYDGNSYATLKFEPTETRPDFYWLNGYGSGSEQIAFLTDIPSIPNLSRTINGNGNAITDISVSGHSIMATKGSTFLTSASSLDASKLTGTVPAGSYTDTTYTAGTGLSLSGTEFSLASHTQASDTINLMTGYSKPSSTSAISASDTLNQAIGKLEKSIDDADISNVVHKTGNETIEGVKTFAPDTQYGTDSQGSFSIDSIYVRGKNLHRGTLPSENMSYVQIVIGDADGPMEYDGTSSGRLGLVEAAVNGVNGVSTMGIYSYEFSDPSSVAKAFIEVGWDAAGNPIAKATPTRTDRTHPYDIVTRDFIPKDTRILHRGVNEYDSGAKSFRNLAIHYPTAVRGTIPSAWGAKTLYFYDNTYADSLDNNAFSDEHTFGWVRNAVDSNGGTTTEIRCFKNIVANNSARLGVVYPASSDPYAFGPSTPASPSNTTLLTYDWIPKDTRIVHTTGDETISGVKTFTNSVYNTVRFSAVHSGVSYDSNPSSTLSWGYIFDDKDLTHIGRCICAKDSNGTTRIKLSVNKPGTTDWSEESYLQVVCTASGLIYATAPTPDAGSDDTKIATTNWVRTATGSTSLNAATATALKTARAFRTHLDSTSADSFDGTANCTPGVTGILGVSNGGTGLSSLSTFVRTTGSQTIAGTKTFSDTVVFSAANIRHSDDAHAFYVCGGNGNTASNGAYMILCGSEWSANPGKFYLRATTASSNTRTLLGTPGGNLTWNGQVIQTSSDARLKTPMSDVPDGALDAWEDVRWGRFKMLDAVEEKGADKARFHVGLIAQQAKAAFDARGLDGCAYGILCYDDDDFDDLWMVRYTEALCMEAAYQRRENARLKKRIAALEERLAALELKIS